MNLVPTPDRFICGITVKDLKFFALAYLGALLIIAAVWFGDAAFRLLGW
jgi:hypothetical protein